MTPLEGNGLFIFVTQSSRINNSTILKAQFMSECFLFLAVSTNAIHVYILILSKIPCPRCSKNMLHFDPKSYVFGIYLVHSTAVLIGP